MVRINLNVYAKNSDDVWAYTPLHIGFFPGSAVKHVIAGLDAIGLAFHSDVANQSGLVHVVTCDMRNGNSDAGNVCVARYEYEPRRVYD